MNDGTVPMDIDNAPEPSTRACHKCRVAEAALSRPLSHCAKCKTTLYCSRACQRADWKAHKKVCGNATTNNSAPYSSSNGNDANKNNNGVDPSLLDPETLPSVFLKAYLLRLYDEHRFFDDDDDDDDRRNRPPVDTLLSSHGNPLRDYRRFLDRAEAAAAAGALALPWWYWVPAGGGKSGSSKGGSGGGDGDGGISAVRQACEDLAKHGGKGVKNWTVVASLFDSKSEITSGDVVLEDEDTLKTLRELAAKICGTTVLKSDEECD